MAVSNSTWRVIGWGVALLVVFCYVMASSLNSFKPPVISLLLGLLVIAIMIIARRATNCPAFVKTIADGLGARKVLTILWICCFLISGTLGTMAAFGRTLECRAKVTAVNSTAANYDETVRRISEARSLCKSVGSKGNVEELDKKLEGAKKAECPKRITQVSSVNISGLLVDQALQKLRGQKKLANEGINICNSVSMPTEMAALQKIDTELGKQIAEGDDTVRQAQQKARNDLAVAKFPSRSNDIRTKLNQAIQQGNQGKWQDEAATLGEVATMLDEFLDTVIEKSPQWVSMSKQVGQQKNRVQPQLDRIREKKELLGNPPSMSGWDGSCSACESALKRLLK